MSAQAVAVRERPILFSGPMVRAVLTGTKTQTRRIVRPQPHPEHGLMLMEPNVWREVGADYPDAESDDRRCPYGVPGDRLWVRETFSRADPCLLGGRPQPVTFYAADNNRPTWAETRWRPSIFMPRSLSRLTLEITDIRCTRLQEISEEDAKAEGMEHHDGCGVGHSGWRHDRGHGYVYPDARTAFMVAWDSINKKRAPWSSNPFVWALTFRVK